MYNFCFLLFFFFINSSFFSREKYSKRTFDLFGLMLKKDVNTFIKISFLLIPNFSSFDFLQHFFHPHYQKSTVPSRNLYIGPCRECMKYDKHLIFLVCGLTYAQADLTHIPHSWKSHATAQILENILLGTEVSLI